MIKKLLQLLNIHYWKEEYTTGVNTYYSCTICNSRAYTSSDCGHQPLNYEWLYGKSDFDISNPPEGEKLIKIFLNRPNCFEYIKKNKLYEL